MKTTERLTNAPTSKDSELRKRCLDLINVINYLPWVYKPNEGELDALNTTNQTIREYLEYLRRPRNA